MVTADSLTGHDWVFWLSAAVLVFNGVWGLRTGSTSLIHRTVTRTEDGYLYWFSVLTSLIVGIGGALVLILDRHH